MFEYSSDTKSFQIFHKFPDVSKRFLIDLVLFKKTGETWHFFHPTAVLTSVVLFFPSMVFVNELHQKKHPFPKRISWKTSGNISFPGTSSVGAETKEDVDFLV